MEGDRELGTGDVGIRSGTRAGMDRLSAVANASGAGRSPAEHSRGRLGRRFGG